MSVFAPYGKIPGAWPTGITQSRGPNGEYLVPYDPYFNMCGEAGFFHDTPLGSPALGWFKRWRLKKQLRGLGAIPTDFEIAKVMGYTPVESGWIATQQGYLTPPWLPPTNQPQGGYALPIQPNDGGGQPESPMALRFMDSNNYAPPGYGLSQPLPSGQPASVEDVISQMNVHNDRVFALALVSTAAVAVSAIITIFRTLKLIREGD